MGLTNFFQNPIGEMFSAWVGLLGVWFYGIIMAVVGIYVLMKIESWYAASASFLFIALLFSALLPMYLIFIWSIAAVFSFAFLLVDILILK